MKLTRTNYEGHSLLCVIYGLDLDIILYSQLRFHQFLTKNKLMSVWFKKKFY